MYIGIDVGGTRTRVAGSASLNKIKLVGKTTTDTPGTFKQGIFEICKNIKKITAHPESIGVGIAGSVSKDGKEFTGSNNLSAWENQPVIKTLKKEFGCPVIIENDAVSQSLAEAFWGAKPGKDFLYIVWGTGVGGALVYQKKNGIKAKKLKRIYLDKWEKTFGGKHLQKRFGKPGEQMNGKEWDIVIPEFVGAVVTLSEKLKMDTVVISGGIVDYKKNKISKALKEITGLKVYISPLGEEVGVYGALALIRAKGGA